jgi:small subunit ribosomal protein S16
VGGKKERKQIMATVIRLKRGGRTHAPYYRLVVVDSRAKITGRVIEEVGFYHPCARPEPKTEINEEAALVWLRKGAQPSATVRSLLSKKGTMAKFAAESSGKATAEAAASE